MDWEVMNIAVSPCPAWRDRRCTTDPVDGSVGHHSGLLRVAGPYAQEGEQPVAWLTAFASHRTGEVLPEPTFSIHSSATDYDLTADEVRMFSAVLLRKLERVTGSSQDGPRPAHLEAVLRLYGPQDR